MLKYHGPWIVRSLILPGPSTDLGESPFVVLYSSFGDCGRVAGDPVYQVDTFVSDGSSGFYCPAVSGLLSPSSSRVYAASARGLLCILWERRSGSETGNGRGYGDREYLQ